MSQCNDAPLNGAADGLVMIKRSNSTAYVGHFDHSRCSTPPALEPMAVPMLAILLIAACLAGGLIEHCRRFGRPR